MTVYWSPKRVLVVVGNPESRPTQGLFRTFAALAEDGILEFAKCYGRLGIDSETARAWIHEIVELRLAVGVWDAVVARDRAGLLRAWEPERQREEVLIRSAPRWAQKALQNSSKREREFTNSGAYVVATVNAKLAQHATVEVAPTEAMDSFRLEPLGRNLLGTLWADFARSIATGQPEGVCRVCKRSFPRTRSDARFCSARCRQRASREKRSRGGR